MSTTTADELLSTLQEGYDLVRAGEPRTIGRDDRLIDDLGLDSLDFIDLVSVFEGRFDTEVVDAVIDRLPELSTAGDLVDAFLAAGGSAASS
jgi:acyl carrier protein